MRAEAGSIVAQSWPVLIAQLASMGMMVIDTILLGHVSAVDLAAIAVGGGIYISVVMALAGVLQSLAPIAAQHFGARHPERAVQAFWQCLWLALCLALPGMLVLAWPDPLLAMSSLESAVAGKTREVLAILALGLPVMLAYRTFYAFCNAVGRTRPLMAISLLATTVHAPLAWALVGGRLGMAPLGAAGCALSTVLVGGGSLLAAAAYLRWGRGVAELRVFAHAARPRFRAFGEFLRLGLPMGFSNFVEITSFTLIALFVAPFGAEVVAGHRIVANLAALAYMLPLSLAIATLARVGQAAGARDWWRCRAVAGAGIAIAVVASGVVGVALYLYAAPLVRLSTGDEAVVGVALSLVGYVAFYQLFDAFQTVAGFSLRGLKITFAPMIAHVVCFWAVGLGGGAWLAFRGLPWAADGTPLAAAGFWLASVWSTVLAGVLFGLLFWRAMRALDRER